jgi:hypothetical protein
MGKHRRYFSVVVMLRASEAFLDDLEVGATGVQRGGGVGVAEPMWGEVEAEVGLGEGWRRHLAAEPAAADVTVSVYVSRGPAGVLSSGMAGHAVRSDGPHRRRDFEVRVDEDWAGDRRVLAVSCGGAWTARRLP